MIEFYMNGGPGMHLFLVICIANIYLAVKNGITLFGEGEFTAVKVENGVNGILFWGVVSFVLGYFFHFLGLYEAAGAIAQAGDVSPRIVTMGYQISLITVLTGQFIFVASAIVWFVLKSKYKTRVKMG